LLTIWQLGLEKYLVLIIVIAFLALGIVYFVALPSFAMYKMLKNSSRTKKTIAFFGYYCLFIAFVIVIFLLPDYAMKMYHYEFASTQLFRFILFLFLTFPLSYLFCIWLISGSRNGWAKPEFAQV
jgi:hypothetical protein